MKQVGIHSQLDSFTLDGQATTLKMRTSFKFMGWLNQYVSTGQSQYLDKAKAWCERVKTQGFHGIRVFGETEDWQGQVFGDAPQNTGVWNLDALRRDERPRELTHLNQQMLEALLDLLNNHELIAEYVVDATLKHTQGVSAAMISHCIRETAAWFRGYGPTNVMNVILSGHNEWDMHNNAGNTLAEINMQAKRMRRWKNDEGETTVSFANPGGTFQAEQWPEAVFMVDHGGANDVEYNYGRGPDEYSVWAIHPERSGAWWLLSSSAVMGRDVPRYFSESKCFDPQAAEHGFSEVSCTGDLDKYLQFMYAALEEGISFCVHDYVGITTDPDQPLSELEKHLAGTGAPPPPPPTNPLPFAHVIRQAYLDILQRAADLEGIRSYNAAMRTGMREAQMRQSLLDSEEFAKKFGLKG